jgi:hypothetical protein
VISGDEEAGMAGISKEQGRDGCGRASKCRRKTPHPPRKDRGENQKATAKVSKGAR